jgi:uncharacterized RDD family membrane protein YckC
MENSDPSISYLLVVNGKPQGPYSVEELKGLHIKSNDFVRSAGMEDYKEAHEIAELRQLLGFSTEYIIPQYFASFDQRLLASALDWFMILGVFICVAFITLLIVTDKPTQMIIVFSMLGIIPLVKLIYHIIMESSTKQGTYGKQILHIKVCDIQGERIGIGKAIFRNCAKLLSVLTFFIGYLFSFFNRQQQCLHDMVAKTLVIKDRLID